MYEAWMDCGDLIVDFIYPLDLTIIDDNFEG